MKKENPKVEIHIFLFEVQISQSSASQHYRESRSGQTAGKVLLVLEEF